MKTASVRPIIFSVEHDLWDDTAQHGAHVTTASSAPDVNIPILMTDVTYCNSLPLTPVTPFLHFEQFNCHFSNPESPTDPRSFQPYTHMLAIFLMFEFFFSCLCLSGAVYIWCKFVCVFFCQYGFHILFYLHLVVFSISLTVLFCFWKEF